MEQTRRYVGKSGYVYVYAPTHPAARPGQSYLPEHRLVVEKRLGRLLTHDEHIHHIDGNKSNNADDNLQVVARAEHSRIHNPRRRIILRCERCGAAVERYRSAVKSRVFCSHACRYAVLAPQVATKRWAGKGRGKVAVPCDHCGTAVERWPSLLSAHVFCSRACKGAAGRGQKRGEYARPRLSNSWPTRSK